MTIEGFFVWVIFFCLGGLALLAVETVLGLCYAAAKPTPSPLDRVADYTLCDSCVDLDKCEDECCPYDWADFGVEVTD